MADVFYMEYCLICQYWHNGVASQVHRTEKECNTCFTIQELSAFPADIESRDGHLRTCSACLGPINARELQAYAEARQPTHAHREQWKQENVLLSAHGYYWQIDLPDAGVDDYGKMTSGEAIWQLCTPEDTPTTREAALAAVAALPDISTTTLTPPALATQPSTSRTNTPR